jgi:hypothetical protein
MTHKKKQPTTPVAKAPAPKSGNGKPNDTPPDEGKGTPPDEGKAGPTKPPIPGPEVDKEKKERIKRAREVFKTHSVDKLYFTSDGQCFVEVSHARMNAQSIKSETVITVTRKEAE